ncbi:GIN domain-containing protein [Mucilaginibacter pedocola]|uniref:Putative auto-transporter adhesin head GIN domain-containing protein n=1 Tax=Mucilaginibacter pedocola TaxID=1792845 RepID=A0A1S9P7A5_9SPHI|nr:DUF2807 domain-containing protein [Mucilaginibacter pedocola]OOQ56840.1 hypothetical protein BC343_17825 [Mucilaginibacter pedocola]
MKTKFLAIVAVIASALATTNFTYAATENNGKEVSTVLTNISQINKIEVHGNVELYVSDGSADQVKVYNQYYAESALVQSQNGVLRISSYKDEKLVVWVTANDLRAISAYDNAAVKSFGSLSKIEFDVDLHDSATAQLNIEAYRASVTVNNNAKATLTGGVTEYSLKYADTASVINDNFITVNESKTQVSSVGKRDIAGL